MRNYQNFCHNFCHNSHCTTPIHFHSCRIGQLDLVEMNQQEKYVPTHPSHLFHHNLQDRVKVSQWMSHTLPLSRSFCMHTPTLLQLEDETYNLSFLIAIQKRQLHHSRIHFITGLSPQPHPSSSGLDLPVSSQKRSYSLKVTSYLPIQKPNAQTS